MLQRLCRAMDRISAALSRVAEAVTLLLVLAMIYEVAARYVFGAPTLWAFDIAYMSTGVLFVLGAAQALRDDAHVRIDLFYSRLPKVWARRIDGVAFLVLLAPSFGALAWVAGGRAWRAFATGEVETVSPWAPLMWPFYALLTIGLLALALQLAVEGLRALTGSAPDPDFRLET